MLFSKLTISKSNFYFCLVTVFCFILFPFQGHTQQANTSNATNGTGLFDSDSVLEITLSGNLHELLNDRAEVSALHHLQLTYKAPDNSMISIPVDAKTRGHFRKLKENCQYPPILLQFPKGDAVKSSIFMEDSKLKLGMPCNGEQYIINEWLVYKLYNLITPNSFRARLVKVKLDDSKSKKVVAPFYGMLLEEAQQMAKRNGTVQVTRKLRPEQTEMNAFLNMAVFEYLIGNTDWSVQYLQNIKLISVDSNSVPITVPYDFDMSGIVNSPYALPAEELEMTSVRQRRYRGYCIQDMKKFDKAIELFNSKKNEIYAVYTNCTLLDPKYVKSTIKFLDEFYATINNEAAVKKEFGYPCDKNGTGNVVIKGLKTE
jgi:hypothetical protein